jgi:hypothetical protein
MDDLAPRKKNELFESLVSSLAEYYQQAGNSAGNITSRGRNDHLDFLMLVLEESRNEIASMNHSEVVNSFFTYDISAKQSLVDLYSFVKHNALELPLFQNRLSTAFDGSVPIVCAIVLTQRRQNAWSSYLVQTISGLLNRMNYMKYKESVYVHVVNVDQHPANHTELNLIRDLVPVTSLFHKLNGSFDIPSKLQEASDYSKIIRMFDKIGCQYPILVEDDALAQVDWMDEVMTAINGINANYSTSWFATKLFNKRDELEKVGINKWPHMYYTVAVLFNPNSWLLYADELDALVARSLKQGWFENTAKDHILDEAAIKAGQIMLSYDPVIFQHTGLASSLGKVYMDDFGETEVLNNPRFSNFFPSNGLPIIFNESHWSVH